jgi:hypothetical protein
VSPVTVLGPVVAATCGRSSSTCRSRLPWSPAAAPPARRSG